MLLNTGTHNHHINLSKSKVKKLYLQSVMINKQHQLRRAIVRHKYKSNIHIYNIIQVIYKKSTAKQPSIGQVIQLTVVLLQEKLPHPTKSLWPGDPGQKTYKLYKITHTNKTCNMTRLRPQNCPDLHLYDTIRCSRCRSKQPR